MLLVHEYFCDVPENLCVNLSKNLAQNLNV